MRDAYFAQRFNISKFKWETVSTKATHTYTSQDNMDKYCKNNTFEEATDLLYRYLDNEVQYRKELKIEKRNRKMLNRKKVFIVPRPAPKVWRVLKRKDTDD